MARERGATKKVVKLRLKEIREQRGFGSLRAAAGFLGISISELWRYEKGDINPGLPMIVHIADCFDVKLDDLVVRSKQR